MTSLSIPPPHAAVKARTDTPKRSIFFCIAVNAPITAKLMTPIYSRMLIIPIWKENTSGTSFYKGSREKAGGIQLEIGCKSIGNQLENFRTTVKTIIKPLFLFLFGKNNPDQNTAGTEICRSRRYVILFAASRKIKCCLMQKLTYFLYCAAWLFR